jgi:hypothetical protein
MALPLRFLVVTAAVLLSRVPTAAQAPVAPEPHLALDELVKEYKRLGLPLPPPNAELVRVKRITLRNSPDELGFRIPATKPGDKPNYLFGSAYDAPVLRAEPFKPGSGIPDGVAPEYVSDLLCLAVQCRLRGLNEFAVVLYARAREAIHTPVPERLGPGPLGFATRVNGWNLRAENSSVLKELRLVALEYWLEQMMAEDSDRKEVLRHLKELEPDRKDDLRALELTVAPRKSKPGTVEALIDDLIDYWPSGKTGSAPLDERERGEAAYRKLVELGFDAVPALLEHLADERLTRYTHSEIYFGKTLGGSTLRVQVRHLVGQLLQDLSGRELFDNFGTPRSGPQSLDATKAREWWEKARKDGEEIWLVAHAVPEFVTARDANAVIFRALGAKYPARLGEFYRTVLAKHPHRGSRVLADEIVASKLPRTDKLALLTEGAEHKSLVHRNAALAALARLDPPAFRKHLLATLKKLPPNVVRDRHSDPLSDLAVLVWRTDDPACWDALAELAKRSAADDRIAIIRGQFYWPNPDGEQATRRELLRFLLRFLSDGESGDVVFGPDGEERPGPRVCDVAVEVLARQLKLEEWYSLGNGRLERLLFRVAVAKLATDELARLKK